MYEKCVINKVSLPWWTAELRQRGEGGGGDAAVGAVRLGGEPPGAGAGPDEHQEGLGGHQGGGAGEPLGGGAKPAGGEEGPHGNPGHQPGPHRIPAGRNPAPPPTPGAMEGRLTPRGPSTSP